MCVAKALLAIVAVGASLGGCQAPRQTFERTFLPDPAKPYIGMTKEQIIACAGTPYNSYSNAKGETFVYHYSGAGPIPTADNKQKSDQGKNQSPLSKPKTDKNWKCGASLAFEDGKLARVTFAPNGVVGPYDTKKDPKTGENVPVPQPDPCTFSLPNCGAH